ncbi:hypothetical protein Misp01_16930 [Microtetraspora sp. NBRC 13810]|uniref:WD40 repeat domain-containing serine/threonine-protein kinase n=1 Tax=Microtetraspora sp. NBRC 13810 TaxID=3030990 RepID=UPI0024A4872B|nr:serine/threonine-protein kinase [Microtetraspora sp. NBRC 13810]GLW06563.1 hypothetical protein Misp01_16930 [Microtetraspora sp. NBRC 13810]
MEPAPLLPGDPRRLGGYVPAGRLGAGGQGVVYQAYDEAGERVAVKVLHTFDRERLVREVTAARRVASFCTAKILDVEFDAPRPYIVSEYVAGPSLRATVREAGPFTGDRLHRLATAVVTALAAIHEAGVIHRDLKPDNVLLGPDGPRVIDFGVARTPEMSLTSTGFVAGTPTYMPPEVFVGQRAGPAADVFSWGGVILFAATGADPFLDESLGGVMHRVLTLEPDVGMLPEPLRALVRAALAKRPEDRPTAKDLLLGLVGSGADADVSLPVPVRDPSLGEIAETVYQGLPAEQRALVPGVFLRLVDTEGTRRALPEEFPGGAAGVLREYRSAGLLDESVEVVHPALPRAWPRLRAWIEEERPGLAVHRALSEAASRWEAGGDVYRGEPLREALRWEASGRRHLTLSRGEAEFLRASAAVVRRGVRRRRTVTAALAVLLLVAAGAAVAAEQSRRTVADQRLDTLAGVVAARAEALRAAEPVTAMRLSAAAWDLAPSPATRGGLYASLAQSQAGTFTDPGAPPGAAYDLSDDGATLVSVSGGEIRVARRTGVTTFSGADPAVSFVRGSPDGRTLALATGEKVRLWDAVSGRPLGGELPATSYVEFSPTGRILALGGVDSPVRLWDVTRGAWLDGPPAMYGALVGPGDRLAAVGGKDYTWRLWDLRRDRALAGLPAEPMAWSPDGRTLALRVGEGSFRLWDVRTAAWRGGAPLRLPYKGEVAFTPDSRFVAALGTEGDLRLWEAGSTAPVMTQRIQTGAPSLLRAGEETLSLVTDGSTVLRVDISAYTAPDPLPGAPAVSGDVVPGAAFSADGRRVALTGDKEVTVWDTATRRRVARVPGPAVRENAPVLSPDGRTIAVPADTPSLTFWDAVTESRLGTLPGTQAAFAADGRTVAVGDGETGALYDLATRAKIRDLPVGGGLSFSADGRWLAGQGVDGLRVIDLRSGRTITPAGRIVATRTVFAPDGRTLVASSGFLDGQVTLIDTATWRRAGYASAGQENAAVAVSPEGVLAVAEKRSVRLWELPGGRELGLPVTGFPRGVAAIGFGGGMLSIAGGDGSLREFPIDGDRAAEAVVARAGGPLSESEWKRHIPEIPYRPHTGDG